MNLQKGWIFLVLILAFGPADKLLAKDPTIISNVTVIDALNGRQPSMDVVLVANRIESVRPASSTVDSGDVSDLENRSANSIDGTGKYLLPGLWDMHVHFTYDPRFATIMPRLFLANGITAVRDTGGLLEAVMPWKLLAEANPERSPRVFIAGPLLDGRPTVYDGSGPGRPDLSSTLTTVEQAESEVDRLAAAGVDLLKAYEMLDPEVFRAILRRGRHHGLPVTGHIPLSMTAVEVSDAGLSSIEHLRNLEISCSPEETAIIAERKRILEEGAASPGHEVRTRAHAAHRMRAAETMDWSRCESVLDVHRRNKTRHVPTLALINSVYRSMHTTVEWRESFGYLPAPLEQDWLASSQQMAGMFDDDPESAAARQLYLDWIDRVLTALAADGMIMAGTDTPIFFMNPGFSLHWELESLVDAGLTPMQAIESATITPARYFGLEDEMGSIRAGQSADLVLLNADPLEDIRHTRQIHAVVRNGKVYQRDDLDRMLSIAIE